MNALQLFNASKLSESIDAALSAVKDQPGEFDVRWELAELLCMAGDLTRADRQLDVLETLDAEAGELLQTMCEGGMQMAARISELSEDTRDRLRRLQGVRAFRQLIRADRSRQELFAAGRPPEFLSQPGELIETLLKVTVELRNGGVAAAADLLLGIETSRSPLPGSCDGEPFTDIRDVDAVTQCCFELLTTNGSYCWLPYNTIKSIEFRSCETPRDVLWRSGRFELNNGDTGEGYFPMIYPGSDVATDEQLRVGKCADWIELDKGFCRGVGGRVLELGEVFKPLINISKIEFESRGGQEASDG